MGFNDFSIFLVLKGFAPVFYLHTESYVNITEGRNNTGMSYVE